MRRPDKSEVSALEFRFNVDGLETLKMLTHFTAIRLGIIQICRWSGDLTGGASSLVW